MELSSISLIIPFEAENQLLYLCSYKIDEINRLKVTKVLQDINRLIYLIFTSLFQTGKKEDVRIL